VQQMPGRDAYLDGLLVLSSSRPGSRTSSRPFVGLLDGDDALHGGRAGEGHRRAAGAEGGRMKTIVSSQQPCRAVPMIG
jgi:hypothetical protein